MGRRRKHREPIPCAVCDTPFIPKDYRTKSCSTECGKILAVRNHPLRGTSKKTPRTCEGCGKEFTPHRENRPQKSCSYKCAAKVRKERNPRTITLEVNEVTCAVCSVPFFYVGGSTKKYCSNKCYCQAMKSRKLNRYHTNPNVRDRIISRAQARRAEKLGLGSAKVVISHLIERDRGICGICKEEVTETTGPMRPSIDHIIPLSRGGTHSMDNVQLAHLQCNLRKGNKLESELAA